MQHFTNQEKDFFTWEFYINLQQNHIRVPNVNMLCFVLIVVAKIPMSMYFLVVNIEL